MLSGQPNNGGIYRNSCFLTTPDIRALFIWEELDLPERILHHYATHAIHFRLFCEAPDSARQLAFTLVQLLRDATSTSDANSAHHGDYALPVMKDLSYCLTPSTVYATAYFTGFERAFAIADDFANSNPQYYTYAPLGDRDWPVTTWPADQRELAHVDNIADCYETLRYVPTVRLTVRLL